jgi:hypothetical protein
MTAQRRTPPVDNRVRVESILQRAVCITLACHWLGNDRKVPVEKVVEAAGGTIQRTDGSEKFDEKQVSATMKLIDRKVVREVAAKVHAAKAYLRSKAIATPRVFGERSYLLPVAALTQVHETLTQMRSEIRAANYILAEKYRDEVNKQRIKMGPLFDPKKYPDQDAVANAFDIDWTYVSFAAPERLETVDKGLFLAAQQKYEQRMGQAYEEVKLVLRETLRQVTGEIVKKLTPGADGKPKVFRNTVLEDLSEFLGTFDVRNIADDADLAAVVTRLRRLTRGVDADRLRDMDDVRAQIAQGMQQATAQLDRLVSTGRRAISFGQLPQAS